MNTKTLTLTALVGASLLVSARADTVTGLVGYWSLTDGPGASTVADASGNGNSGTLLNFADTTYTNMWTGSTDPTNQWPSALLFNQSGEGTNTYVRIPNSAAIDSMSANRAWTLAAWVKCSVDGLSQTNGACIVSKGNQSREAFALYINAGKFTTTFRNSAGTGSETVFSTTTPAVDTWYHVVATVLEPKGSADAEAMVYVNGVRDSGPDANTYTSVYSTTLPVMIGCRPNSSGTLSNPFQGTIDEVRLYNRCLSASDIAELYQHKSTLAPTIATQPVPQSVYVGGSAGFTVTAIGLPPMSYQWRKNGVNLSDGGNIAGSLTSALKVRPVSSGDAGNYDVIITNRAGSVTSVVATLTLATPTGETYETAVRTNNPVAYWQLNETGDPATNNSPVFDYMGGYNGIYDVSVQNGNPAYNIAGPQTGDGLPGFGSANTAAQFGHWAGSDIRLAPLNLNTSTVTITAWIKPNSPQAALNAILFCRGGDTVSGLRYGNFADGGGNYTLGYAWNNETPVANWNSQLTPPLNQWSFVALVVTPTNAIMYLFNTNGLLSANNVYNHTNQSFGAATTLGWETGGSSSGGRAYSSTMDEVAVFNRSLSQQEIVNLYSAASGVASFAPSIGVQPASQTLYVGQTAQLLVTAGGTSPLYYQWQAGPVGSGVFTNVVNGGNVSGATTATLAFTNVAFANAADYLVIVTNLFGAATSSVATVTVQPTGPPENITMSTTQPSAGNPDWNTGSYWSDGNPASVSAVSNPGSTYELLPGALMRSPNGATYAAFPGDVLTVDGNGVWVNNGNAPATAASTIAEIRFKQASVGTVYFKKLVMNGGQLDTTTGTKLIIAGEMDVLTNTPIYNDTANNFACRIDAWLTGTGTIEYHAYNQPAFVPGTVYGLNITGTSNTFSGKWNVVMGVLLGSAPGSLGTNNIVVGANGALETTYDINNPQGSLVLSGRMFLHQNDTFKSVFVSGVPLDPGTYSFAQLNSNYPACFPATWTQQDDSSTAAGSGSITVLAASPPVIITQPASKSWYVGQPVQFTVTAAGWRPLAYQWRIGTNGVFVNLNDGGQFAGSTTPVLTISNIAPANGTDYDVVITNSLGSVTSSVATLTVLPLGPAANITMSAMEPQNSDWDTGTYWSDGNPASVSAISNAGSTYEVLPGARLRSPAGATSTETYDLRNIMTGEFCVRFLARERPLNPAFLHIPS